MDETNDKINKLKSKIDKLYQDISESSKESKNKDRMKRLTNDLEEATKKINELEKNSKNFLGEDEETDFRYIHPKVGVKDDICGTSPVTKGKIDALIARLRELRNTP